MTRHSLLRGRYVCETIIIHAHLFGMEYPAELSHPRRYMFVGSDHPNRDKIVSILYSTRLAYDWEFAHTLTKTEYLCEWVEYLCTHLWVDDRTPQGLRAFYKRNCRPTGEGEVPMLNICLGLTRLENIVMGIVCSAVAYDASDPLPLIVSPMEPLLTLVYFPFECHEMARDGFDEFPSTVIVVSEFRDGHEGPDLLAESTNLRMTMMYAMERARTIVMQHHPLAKCSPLECVNFNWEPVACDTVVFSGFGVYETRFVYMQNCSFPNVVHWEICARGFDLLTDAESANKLAQNFGYPKTLTLTTPCFIQTVNPCRHKAWDVLRNVETLRIRGGLHPYMSDRYNAIRRIGKTSHKDSVRKWAEELGVALPEVDDTSSLFGDLDDAALEPCVRDLMFVYHMPALRRIECDLETLEALDMPPTFVYRMVFERIV